MTEKKLVNEISKNIFKEKSKTKSFYIQLILVKKAKSLGYILKISKTYMNCVLKKLFIGLMCIPPFDQQSEDFFNEMRSLRDNLDTNLDLSMGMSSDYKVSLECGSNLIRVGSRIFN